jgi:hypothetical protein
VEVGAAGVFVDGDEVGGTATWVDRVNKERKIKKVRQRTYTIDSRSCARNGHTRFGDFLELGLDLWRVRGRNLVHHWVLGCVEVETRAQRVKADQKQREKKERK